MPQKNYKISLIIPQKGYILSTAVIPSIEEPSCWSTFLLLPLAQVFALVRAGKSSQSLRFSTAGRIPQLRDSSTGLWTVWKGPDR
jgi:hypothetical protein